MKENIVQKPTSKDDKYACVFTDRIVAESHDTNTIELNLNEMEMINGGWKWKKSLFWGVFGTVIGASIGAQIGGGCGAVAGGLIGGTAGVLSGDD